MRLHIFIECDVVNQQNFVNLFVVLTFYVDNTKS